MFIAIFWQFLKHKFDFFELCECLSRCPICVTFGKKRMKTNMRISGKINELVTFSWTSLYIDLLWSVALFSTLNVEKTEDYCKTAIRKFISRRVCPTRMFSDNWTNLKEVWSIQKSAAPNKINWKFTLPKTLQIGGDLECRIRTAKPQLSIHHCIIYMELHNTFCESETNGSFSAINWRFDRSIIFFLANWTVYRSISSFKTPVEKNVV